MAFIKFPEPGAAIICIGVPCKFFTCEFVSVPEICIILTPGVEETQFVPSEVRTFPEVPEVFG